MHHGTVSKPDKKVNTPRSRGTTFLIWILAGIVFVVGYWIFLTYYFAYAQDLLKVFASLFRDWMIKAGYQSNSPWYWLTVWTSGTILVLPISLLCSAISFFLTKKKWIVFLVLMFTLAQGYDAYFQSETYFYGYPSIDTYYTEGYSPEKWQVVAEGMNKEEVITVLSQPFEVGQTTSPECASEFIYSRDGKAGPYLDFAWNAVFVCFNDKNEVTFKGQEFRYD